MDKKKGILIECAAVMLLATGIIFGILIKAGTLRSGVHFADDHELYRIEYQLKIQGQPLVKTMLSWIDLIWRFRPLYWVERVGCTAIFGSELFYWNCYTAVKGVLIFLFFYFAARNLRFDCICSFLFPCVVLLGTQFTPIYRSANQESTGLLFCAAAFWLIARQYRQEAFRSKKYNILICLCAIACGLLKESFVLFLPVFGAVKYWLEYCRMCDRSPQKGNWIKCLKNNGLTYGAMILALAVDLYFILFRVGVDKVSYAGFHEGTPLSFYLTAIRENLIIYLREYTLMGMVFLAVIAFSYELIDKKDLRIYLGFGCIGVYILGTQLVAHAQSRIWERYIIPYSVGYAMLFVLLGYRVFAKKKVQRALYLLLLCCLLYKKAHQAYFGAFEYAWDGKMTGQFYECLKSHTDSESLVLGAFMDEELNLSVESIMETDGRSNIFSYRWDQQEIVNLIRFEAGTREAASLADADVVACYSSDVEAVLGMMGLTEGSEYEIFDFGRYCFVVSKANN